MKLQSKYADLVLNLLVAVAISLVVNFSYVLLMLVDLNSDSQPRPSDQRAVERPDEGVLSVHPDGYGYLVYENGDSVYVPTRRMRWLEIAPGDRIVADLMPPRSEKAHPMLAEIRTRPDARSIEICYKPGNANAKQFYASMGFVEKGLDADGNDMLAVIQLGAA